MPFPGGSGRDRAGVEQVGDEIELVVSDDGVGMKEKVAAKLPEKRGSDYVAIFVRQLGGTIVPAAGENRDDRQGTAPLPSGPIRAPSAPLHSSLRSLLGARHCRDAIMVLGDVSAPVPGRASPPARRAAWLQTPRRSERC